ncbi:aconitate hydratase [Bilophila wadsworthia]|uniref:Aconitate hydratase A n=2 Tax=Bilophila wadsworthia TaxID=35833 RepID=E5Y7N9_BILW3|nr:aconitate hydratase [Bilophila wadsworthia]MBP8914947.1 aconitate hydratase [Bilophila sp.]MBS1376314.1 aconitate hydratase [Desulfovibrionaceae bacterium]EFV43998.1 aconitate hydratase 1 [Bilophila wadsworthia 3_1_6]MCB8572160.1 aconitate hydratase [Bilophila wadsworthia]MCC2715510.1 aconitate hydratase [Bilophila wadsworthia]
MNLTQKIIGSHLVSGTMTPGSEIGLRIDQTLTQDATGTMAWLQFEALGIPRVKTDISLSYVDHNTLQMNFRNPDDHRFLRTVAAKFGGVYSGPGTGICHQLHLENFAKPGATLVGSDSHTPTAGGICSLAMGAGGLSVALAMAGEPYYIPMPKVVRVFLTGALTGWASAKDVILELLRRRTVKGGVGRVFEYAGPGVATLSVPERATIANMGAELGATGTLFPSDGVTRAFLKAMGREADWRELGPDADAAYDEEEAIDLSALVPLAAQPHMPDRVVPVAELDGLPVEQVCIGSCTNSSYADLKLVAQILDGHRINPGTDAMISPGSKQVLTMLAQEGLLEPLIGSGARLLECSCGPCIGSGGAPVTSGVSARTFNRNFEGRSGTKDAKVYLVSPLTAAQAALNGKFTDPATWGTPPAKPELPADPPSIRHLFVFPPENGDGVEVLRGPNIVALEKFPRLDASGDVLEANVVIRLGDNITTDHIMPAGAEILALRSNIPAISEHVFVRVDPDFVKRARAVSEAGGNGVIVAGENYGQGSSREHAALAPRHLGIRAVIALSMARIHRANLVNFGILPLVFVNREDYAKVAQGADIRIPLTEITPGGVTNIEIAGVGVLPVRNDLSAAELDIIRSGGLLNAVKEKM